MGGQDIQYPTGYKFEYKVWPDQVLNLSWKSGDWSDIKFSIRSSTKVRYPVYP